MIAEESAGTNVVRQKFGEEILETAIGDFTGVDIGFTHSSIYLFCEKDYFLGQKSDVKSFWIDIKNGHSIIARRIAWFKTYIIDTRMWYLILII